MISTWLSAVLAVAGVAIWMLTKEGYNAIVEWKTTLVTSIGVIVLWLVWWQAGIEFFGWQAGQFNWAVFGLAWAVPSFLDHIIPQLNKLTKPTQ